ncbi:MAG TPA: HAMP domain-containing sensor histidine kinase [Rhizomicrobium sp.]|nr:HAMP domain-containing sensor histidine kinase [Rhizomicrobium sp.]
MFREGLPVRRVSDLSIVIKTRLDGLDENLSRLGSLGSTMVLTALAIGAALIVQVVLRVLEGRTAMPIAIVNVSVEVAVVAGPLIFYARDVIAELRRSRSHLDVMSRRLAASVQQAEAANKAKSAFLANMSHELRTPLNAIMGFSEVMKEEVLGPMNNPRYIGYAGDIHASGQYLLGIINDILDLSKIEAGKMSLDSAKEFALAEAVSASLTLLAPLGDKHGVQVSSSLPSDVRLVAVERMIRQILINLLGNAIKFTPAGGSVEVSGAPMSCGGYALTVRDSGIGMTEEGICRAMMPFGQVENKMTATHNGTGLGLPLAKAMLELHGGTMTVQSVPHVGTTITLGFPASRIARGQRAVAA